MCMYMYFNELSIFRNEYAPHFKQRIYSSINLKETNKKKYINFCSFCFIFVLKICLSIVFTSHFRQGVCMSGYAKHSLFRTCIFFLAKCSYFCYSIIIFSLFLMCCLHLGAMIKSSGHSINTLKIIQ